MGETLKMQIALDALRFAVSKYDTSEREKVARAKNLGLRALSSERMAFLSDKYIRENYSEVFYE